MDRVTIFEKLTTVFRKIFNDDTIVLKNELTARDVANWDSLSHMLMIGEVEKEFSIKFKLKELNKLDNVSSLIELIKSKLA
ncbi:MAG: acyl carrier protein [Ferruginibacter sp.]